MALGPLARPRNIVSTSLLALALLTSACGGDGDKEPAAQLPSLETSETTDSGDDNGTVKGDNASSEPMTEAEMTRVLEQYRDCMDAEELPGVVVTVGFEDGLPNIGIDQDGDDTDDAALLAAEEKCEPILADLFAQFEDDPRAQALEDDALLEMQRCLAEKGIVIDISEGGIDVNFDAQETPLDDETYENAEAECAESLGEE